MIEKKLSGNELSSYMDTARKRFDAVVTAEREDRILYEEDVEFDEGIGIWSDAAKAARGDRPCLNLNKTVEKTQQAEGEFRQAEMSIEVVGIDSDSDPKLAEIIEGVIRNIEFQSSARAAYAYAFSCLIKGGRGAWRYDIKENPFNPWEPDIEVLRILNPLTVYSDPGARRPERSDKQWCFVSEWIPEEEFMDRYPGKSLTDWDLDTGDKVQWLDSDRGVRIAEYWKTELVSVDLYQVFRQGKVQVVGEEQLVEGEQIIDKKTAKVPQIWHTKINGVEPLEPLKLWPGLYIPVVEVFGKETWLRGKVRTRGMIRHAKEPARMYAYWASNATEEAAMAPRSPYILTPDMIKGHEALWDSHYKVNRPYLLVNPDMMMQGAFPMRQQPSAMSTAYAAELERMDRDVSGAMGVHPPKLGMTEGDQSGRAIIARQKMGDATSYVFTDAMQTGLLYGFRILTDLIPKVYDTERIVRIMGQDGTEKQVPVNQRQDSPDLQPFIQDPKTPTVANAVSEYVNDLSVGRYDVRGKIGLSYSTQREEAADFLFKVFSMLPPETAANALDLLFSNFDFKGSRQFVERFRKMIPIGVRDLEPGEQPPPPPPPHPAMLIEEQKLKLKFMELVLKAMEAEPQAILKLAQAESLEAGTQLNMYKAFLDTLGLQFQQVPQQAGGQPGFSEEQKRQDPFAAIGPSGTEMQG